MRRNRFGKFVTLALAGLGMILFSAYSHALVVTHARAVASLTNPATEDQWYFVDENDPVYSFTGRGDAYGEVTYNSTHAVDFVTHRWGLVIAGEIFEAFYHDWLDPNQTGTIAYIDPAPFFVTKELGVGAHTVTAYHEIWGSNLRLLDSDRVSRTIHVIPVPMPEPSTLLIMLLGLICLRYSVRQKGVKYNN